MDSLIAVTLSLVLVDHNNALKRCMQIDEVVEGILNERSEVQQLTAELREARERARAAEDQVSQLAQAEAERRVRLTFWT